MAFEAIRSRMGGRARLFFDSLVLITFLLRGRRLDERVDAGGFEGAIHFELTGPGGGDWHLRIASGTMRFFRGAHPAPKSTVTIAARTFADLLAGRGSWITAQMTGKVRVAGDGHAGLLFGGMIAQVRARGARPGWRGRLARALLGEESATPTRC